MKFKLFGFSERALPGQGRFNRSARRRKPAVGWLVLWAVLAPYSGAASAQGVALEELSWLAGCWASEADEAGSGEQWMPLAGGTLLGMGRTVKGGKTVTHEFMQIRLDPRGAVIFVAAPAGRPETTFTLKSRAEQQMVFENLQHDFPQRVIYRRVGAERLEARIEGLRSGVLRGVDFGLRRADCLSMR